MIGRLEPRSWLLVALAGWSLAFAVVALVGFGGRSAPLPDNHGLAPDLPTVPNTAAHPALRPLEAYAQAYDHPLFFPDRKPAAAHVPGKSADDHPLDAVLTGIIKTPTLQMAIVQDPKTHRALRVREGQPIGGPYGGWKLTEVQPRAATFQSDSQGTSTLDLRIYNGKGGPEPTHMGLTPQAVAAGVLGVLQRATGTDVPADADAASTNAGQDAGQDAAKDDATAPDPQASAGDAAAQATAQAALHQAEMIRRRIEARRRQALQARQSNESSQ